VLRDRDYLLDPVRNCYAVEDTPLEPAVTFTILVVHLTHVDSTQRGIRISHSHTDARHAGYTGRRKTNAPTHVHQTLTQSFELISYRILTLTRKSLRARSASQVRLGSCAGGVLPNFLVLTS
jgi:hypothetical protein